MDWLLIGSLWGDVAGWFYTWGLVIVGLGLVIFIHELGHFLVAKACGVKCEKFYVGFDVPISIPLGKLGTLRLPRTFWKRQWGETEYGVGILPLGGYVKMLGQDDNPYRQEEEYERAKAATADAEGQVGGDSTAEAPAATAIQPAPPTDPPWDPRSYLAKSVPQRMAIISAGVIMNVILAFALAAIAYGFGVKYMVPVVGHVMPGSAAWHHRWPVGLELLSMNGIEEPRYDKDVVRLARLAEKGQSIEVTYLDPRTGETVHDTIEPVMSEDKLSRLGITPAPTLQLYKERFALPVSPAWDAGFEGEDRIVAVKAPGQEKPIEVTTFAQLHEIFVRHPEKTLEVVVERGGGKAKERASVLLRPMPMKDLGLVMKLGKIIAVQPHSPAAEAGIEAGDEIVRITGDGPDDVLSSDPLYLPELLRRRSMKSGATIKVVLMRDGRQLTREVPLREPTWSEEPIGSTDQKNNLTDEPMSAPALGIAYEVLNEIASVTPGSPAEKSGSLKPGQTVTQVKIVPPSSVSKADRETWGYRDSPIPLGNEKRHWPAVFFQLLQERAPTGATVEVYVEGRDEPVSLELTTRSDWHRSERGINLQPILAERVAGSFGEALRLGLRETGEAMSLVFVFLRRIPDLWRHAAGPVGIVQFAGSSVAAGFTTFLLFLTMLSANLAVINILPIPVLDGGHLMFLTYEGIRRKPPSEKVVIGLNFLGLALILSVMVLVLTLDLGRLFSG